jgi:hypothetical protein
VQSPKKTEDFSRKVMSGSFGNSVSPLPIQLQTTVVNGGNSPGDRLFVDFIITNTGPKPEIIPISPYPRDFEPKDSGKTSFECLSLFLTAGHPGTPLMLKGGANLYGEPHLPSTVITLKPSESLVVHTKFVLASWNGSIAGVQTFTGHILLVQESLKPKGSNLESTSAEIASASASAFTWTVSSQ